MGELKNSFRRLFVFFERDRIVKKEAKLCPAACCGVFDVLRNEGIMSVYYNKVFWP